MPKRTSTGSTAGSRGAAQKEQEGPAAKVPRGNVMFSGVVEAINKAGLNPQCARMLAASLPNSLGLPKEERHEVQLRVIDMLDEVLLSVRQRLQDAADAAAEKTAELERSQDSLAGKALQAGDEVTAAAGTKEAKVASLAAAGKDVEAASEVLKQKQSAQKTCEAELAAAREKKQSFSAGVEEHFKPLVGGELEAGVAEEHQLALMSLVEESKMEDSCRAAMPKSCVKPLSERSAIDVMVFEEVSKAIEVKTSSLAKAANDSETMQTTLSSEIEAAKGALEAARTSQREAAAEVAEATTQEADARTAAAQAKQACDNFKPDLEKSIKERGELAEQLENYVTYNMGCLQMLRDSEQQALPSKGEEEATPSTAEATAMEGVVSPAGREAGTVGMDAS